MQIIILNDYAHKYGGASKVAISSAVELARTGHNVTLFTAVNSEDETLKRSGVKLITLGQHDILSDPNRRRSVVQGVWNTAAINKLYSLLAEVDRNNTVIHVHCWPKALSLSPVYAALKKEFKVVVTLHDYFLACPNGGFFNYSTREPCELHALGLKCLFTNCDVRNYGHKLWRYSRTLFNRLFLSLPGKIDNFITVSDFSHHHLKAYLSETANFFKVSNPIDIDLEAKVDAARNDLFVMVSRVSPEKGIDIFCQAASDLGLPAVIVGDGPDTERIKSKFKNITVTGWLDTDGVKKYLQKARALVFPSLLYETQGLSVLEAAAKGIPSIVSDSCAAKEAVLNDQDGLLYRSGDVEDLKQMMSCLAFNTDKVESMSKNAYNRYWDDPPTLEKHANDLLSVYQDILS